MKIKLLSVFAAILSIQATCHAQDDDHQYDYIGVLDVSPRHGGDREWFAAQTEENSAQIYTISTQKLPVDGSEQNTNTTIQAAEFSSIEIGYEFPVILVYRRYANWVQVHISGKPVWLKLDKIDKYIPYENILTPESLTYLTSPMFEISDNPNGESRLISIEPSQQGIATSKPFHFTPSVEILGRAVFHDYDSKPDPLLYERYGTNHPGIAWIHIRVLSYSHCNGPTDLEASSIAEGWVPAHQSNGNVNFSIASRGC